MSGFILAELSGAFKGNSKCFIPGYVVLDKTGRALARFDPTEIAWSEKPDSLAGSLVFQQSLVQLVKDLAGAHARFAKHPVAQIMKVHEWIKPADGIIPIGEPIPYGRCNITH